MDGWMDGRRDAWMNGWVHGWMDGRVDEWTDGWKHGWMGGWTNGQLVEWIAERVR